MLISIIVIFALILAAQPTITTSVIPKSEWPDGHEDCAHVEIVRFDILRRIDPEMPVFVMFDSVMCDGDSIEFNGRQIND